MIATHLEFASDVDGLRCPVCARRTVREAVLVNPYGLVLARHRSCVHCGHLRHRASRRTRRVVRVDGVHSGVIDRARLPRVA